METEGKNILDESSPGGHGGGAVRGMGEAGLESVGLFLPKDQMVAQIVSYIDESASGDVLVVAACIATADNWKAFDREWNEMLSDFGANGRPLPYIHIRELVNRRSPLYEHIGDKRFLQLATRISRIMDKYIQYCIVHGIDKAAHDKIITRSMKSRFGTPYATCVGSIIFDAMRLLLHSAAKDGGNIVLNIVIEQGHRNQDETIGRLMNLRRDVSKIKNFPLRIGTLADAEKAMPGLQAADIMATNTMWHDRNGFIPRDTTMLMEYIPGVIHITGEAGVRGLLNQAQGLISQERERGDNLNTFKRIMGKHGLKVASTEFGLIIGESHNIIKCIESNLRKELHGE